MPSEPSREVNAPDGAHIATLAAGCFWCVEAVFEQVEGVLDVVSGYTGGQGENPTYEQVSRGHTGHAEAVQLAFDPARVSYERLLEIFWQTHDPTTRNRQGADIGTQYRSAVFYHDDAQRDTATAVKERLDRSGLFAAPIVTEIVPAGPFYPAEINHQDYFRSNPNAPYCRLVIVPKLKKLEALEKP